MSAKTQWAKSGNGPDWTDIETMMRAIGALHSGLVVLCVSPLGIGSTGGVHLTASMSFDLLPGSSLPPRVETEVNWPNPDNATLEGCAYRLLFALDAEISIVYKQEGLWK